MDILLGEGVGNSSPVVIFDANKKHPKKLAVMVWNIMEKNGQKCHLEPLAHRCKSL